MTRPRTAVSNTRSVYTPEERQKEHETLEKGIKANEKNKPFKFLSTVGGVEFRSEEEIHHSRPQVNNHQLKCREPVDDINTRAISAMNTLHIDRPIDPKLYRFGTKSASANEIEQKIKSHNYIMSLKKTDNRTQLRLIADRFAPTQIDTESKPYTASALLNDKPQFRITTPNLASGKKVSLGELLSDDQYRQELRQLEIVEDASEDPLE